MFKDVVEACRNYAFEKSDYPVIFSIENHCSVEQQDKMADILVNILGELLYTNPISQEEEELPSPEQLRRKILIKAKKLPAEGTKDAGISKKLSDLVNYIEAVKFYGFDNAGAKFYHMSSFKETDTISYIEEKGVEFVKYNSRQISRLGW